VGNVRCDWIRLIIVIWANLPSKAFLQVSVCLFRVYVVISDQFRGFHGEKRK